MRRVRILVAGAAVIALAGCATLRPPTPGGTTAAWQRHAAWVRAHPDWVLQGRFALDVAGRGWTASLHWRENGPSYHVDIFDPFGRAVAQLDGEPHQVVLRARGKPPYRADSAAALMQARLGWSLPVEGLRYWVRGLPAPGVSPTEMNVDGSGRLERLRQDGWAIHYLDYDNRFGARALPTRLRLVNGDVRLTLLIDHWGNAG